MLKLPKLPKLPDMARVQNLPLVSKLPQVDKTKLADLADMTMGVISPAVFAHMEAIANELRQSSEIRASHYRYGLGTVRSIVQLAGSGATIWLIHRKAREARIAALATTAAVAGLSVASRFTEKPDEDHDDELLIRDRIVNVVIDCMPNVIASLTLCAPDANTALTSNLDLAPRNPTIPFSFAEQTRNLISLYGTYTIVGHWLEMLFCILIKYGIVGGEYDRSNKMLWDWWLHPFPAEGIAGVLISLLLSPLREKLLVLTRGRIAPALAISFLANQIVCTSIDYLTGMVANRNYELWDYRNMPFNYKGQICLQNSLVYSAAATFVTWVAYPLRMEWLRSMPADIANMSFASFLPVYLFISSLYFI